MLRQLRLLTLAILLPATSSWAVPMLSPDGSTLTGVDVGGTLYDVMFGDGIVGDVYAGVVFNSAREAEANAVSSAVVAALNSLNALSHDIAGCSLAQCYLFNPDTVNNLGVFSDSMVASAIIGAPVVWVVDIGNTFLAPSFVTTDDFFQVTLLTYITAVPEPTTLLLFGLGLAGLGVSRRKRETHDQTV